MIKGLKKMALIGMLTVAGGIYNSGGTIETYPKPEENYCEKLSNFLGKQSELFIASDLEKKVKEERESFIEGLKHPLYLNEDLINNYIKKAQKNVGKLPKEIDKRLFRLMLKQESQNDAHAVSPTGYMGIGQVGYDVYKTFRPEKWESFRDPVTGIVDTLSVKKEIFNPLINLELSIQSIRFNADYCEKNDPNWKSSNIDIKRGKILTSYNAGQWNLQKANWDTKSKKLKEENRNYSKVIMEAYNNPAVKVKL
jgi:soluble lytic murein transglycosylase-like protein